MIPVVQSVVGDGKEGRPMGDCFRACVASIFEMALDAVPDFVSGGQWYIDFRKWVRDHGWPIDVCNTTHRKVEGEGADRKIVLDKSPNCPPTCHVGYWIGTVMSEHFGNDATHAVVMRGSEIAHDPSPHPRSTPYEFVGGTWFEVTDPAAIVRAVYL